MKTCNNPKCNIKNPQPLENFNKNKNNKDGLHKRCKDCVKKSVKKSYIKNREYYIEDTKKRKEKYKKENPEKLEEWKIKSNNRLKEKGYWKKYYKENKNKFKKYFQQEEVKERNRNRWKEKYQNDIKFKLREVMKANFHLFFKDKGLNKNLSFTKVIKYTYKDLQIHLENNFREGMDWDNYGELWEIHHIKPQNMFNPMDINDVKECWKLNNLIPLWKTTQIAEKMGDNTLGNRNVPKDKIYKP